MALPPRALGDRVRAVRLEHVDGERWRTSIDGVFLSSTFTSEREARGAATAELIRLDAVALALLRRLRAGLSRKHT